MSRTLSTVARRSYFVSLLVVSMGLAQAQTLGHHQQPGIGETRKAHERRVREGFYTKYCKGFGIDIGLERFETIGDGFALPVSDLIWWDRNSGDPTFMAGVADQAYDFVYSSHLLEHTANPTLTLKNWWRIVKPGGYLILFLPHRDLYEKRNALPSRWNPDHRFFILPDKDELPYTLGLKPLVQGALGKSGLEIVYMKVCSAGHTITNTDIHSDGEYSIEMVLRKRKVLTPPKLNKNGAR